jgi:hypothetical protein
VLPLPMLTGFALTRRVNPAFVGTWVVSPDRALPTCRGGNFWDTRSGSFIDRRAWTFWPAIEGHVRAKTELIGRYGRQPQRRPCESFGAQEEG